MSACLSSLSLMSLRSLAASSHCFGPFVFSSRAAFLWATILRPLLRPDGVAVGVVAVVVRVEDVLDRLLGRLLDGRDHVAGLLREVGVDDDDVVLEDDPDVVAAAERDLRVGGA